MTLFLPKQGKGHKGQKQPWCEVSVRLRNQIVVTGSLIKLLVAEKEATAFTTIALATLAFFWPSVSWPLRQNGLKKGQSPTCPLKTNAIGPIFIGVPIAFSQIRIGCNLCPKKVDSISGLTRFLCFAGAQIITQLFRGCLDLVEAGFASEKAGQKAVYQAARIANGGSIFVPPRRPWEVPDYNHGTLGCQLYTSGG